MSARKLCAVNVSTGTERILADLSRRQGRYLNGHDTDGKQIYFGWSRVEAEIGLMDVAQG